MCRTEMSNDKSAAITILEAHEEFVQHIESGSSKIRLLSAVTIGVSSVLSVSYVYQLVFPYLTGESSVVVNLVDPVLQTTEVVVAALASLWLYVGVRDYLFTKRMDKAIREARTLEKEIQKRVS
jgi:hypothetical protein